jgi:hypothetical protein
MLEKYLGDSYDLVKRFWREALNPIAPLYAHPKFVPSDIAARYTALTSIPILDTDARPSGPFGILLDPHTGIPLPKEPPVPTTAKLASLSFIVETDKEFRPRYMVCFDQSSHRKHELDKSGQRAKKMEFLQNQGLGCFYYISHAPFLFVASDPNVVQAIRERLLSLGIPETRLEPR